MEKEKSPKDIESLTKKANVNLVITLIFTILLVLIMFLLSADKYNSLVKDEGYRNKINAQINLTSDEAINSLVEKNARIDAGDFAGYNFAFPIIFSIGFLIENMLVRKNIKKGRFKRARKGLKGIMVAAIFTMVMAFTGAYALFAVSALWLLYGPLYKALKDIPETVEVSVNKQVNQGPTDKGKDNKKYCTECGAQSKQTAKFCQKCGNQF